MSAAVYVARTESEWDPPVPERGRAARGLNRTATYTAAFAADSLPGPGAERTRQVHPPPRGEMWLRRNTPHACLFCEPS